MTAIQEFTEIFGAEHRHVRDLLFALIEAFQNQDTERARSLITAVAAATGPHFRYEEEAMYPQLTGIFGAPYVEKLLADHDGAIRNVGELQLLAGHGTLTPGRAARGAELARQILPHVSDCDGLSIMVETLPDGHITRILDARTAALDAGLDLLAWAATARQRRA